MASTIVPTILSADCMESVETPNGRMVVVGRRFPVGTEVEAILSGAALADEVRVSSDGRDWTDAWHEGAESGEVAYVERYDADGRQFHGWVDAESRRLVQVG